MSEKSIPCVIVHKGYKPYLKYNLEITSKNNKIFLIGDNSIKSLENLSKNITFIDISKIEENINLERYKNFFVNYSTNSLEFEWFCFARVFLINSFLESEKLQKIFYIDSDNVLLTDINDLSFKSETAYLIPQFQSDFRMTASIHSGLISKEFCREFINLYEDIYINKNRFDLISKKIEFHKENKIPGGICDMTFHYLIHQDGNINIQNLMKPLNTKNNKLAIFMNNLNNAEGFELKDNYQLKKGRIQIFNGNKILDLSNNKKIEICNIHFQGAAKKHLNYYQKFKLSY